jgi:hypothetical protein
LAKFDSLDNPNENRIMFARKGRFGYMDGEGQIAIAPQYENAQRFSEGLAAVLQ